MSSARLILLLCLFAGMTSSFLRAGELETKTPVLTEVTMVEAKLLLGQNDFIRDDIAKDHCLRKSLDRLIGYKFYEIIGNSTATVGSDQTEWLLPSKTFFFEVKKTHNTDTPLNVRLWQEHKLIVDSNFKPKPGMPLIITGPKHGDGQIILVLFWPELKPHTK